LSHFALAGDPRALSVERAAGASETRAPAMQRGGDVAGWLRMDHALASIPSSFMTICRSCQA
jgi:hypothetical protein